MPGSTKSFLFPDINVWLALTYEGHVHHVIARDWFASLSSDCRLFFCRFTQLGLLRLLTAQAVMGPETMNQQQAWKAYDAWLEDARVAFLDEPAGIEHPFRANTQLRSAAVKDWADSYLAAFATAARLTVVSFDRGFRAKADPVILLKL